MAIHVQLEIKVFWLIGFILSTAALLFQITIYILLPSSRKLSQKLLTQMTIARLLNVALEYTVAGVSLKNSILNDAVFTFYWQTDAALICWMFVFTKNLYEDIIVVFTEKSNFILVTVIIWTVTFPMGVLAPIMLNLDQRNLIDMDFSYFAIFYKTYSIIKFIILCINLILFGIIFKVAVARGRTLRTCLVSFGLVSISSTQVLVTDLLSYSMDEYPLVSLAFGVINSYQILAITAIFVILVQNLSEQSLSQRLAKKFVKVTI